jgi:hypothetical protein
MQWDPMWRLDRPLGGLFPVMAAEGPRHRHRQGVGALSMHVAPPGHTDCCGTRWSDNPVRAS